MGFYPTYISYQAGLMFGFVANVQQSPFGFTFEDDGVFEAVGGAKADYMAFDRYSAPDYSQSSYVQGVARMYGEMVFMKVEGINKKLDYEKYTEFILNNILLIFCCRMFFR